MKHYCLLLIFFFLSFLYPLKAQEENKEEKEVLVFYKTEGFWHKSIPTGYNVIEDLGEDHGFEVESTEETDEFTKDGLQKYDLVIFLNTTGDVLSTEEEKAFEDYMENGGNFFGIHAAADAEYNWKWYGELVGAYFKNHPKIQEAEVKVNKPKHPTVAHLPHIWTRKDEWYNYKDINPEIQVLLYLDESTYEGGSNGQEHPIAWYRELEGGGKTIYTGGGHTIRSYYEPAFKEHLLQCILYAIGETK